jgi:WD40 repeat protein
MPKRKNSPLEGLLASPQAESWRRRLAGAFFDAELREQALRELREQLPILEPALSPEECAEVERLLLAAASRRAAPPARETAETLCTGETLADRVIHSYPYPVARPFLALTEAEPGAGTFGCLLDTLEGLVHFLAVVAVCAYQRGGLANPECSRHLAERFLKGLWSTGDLFVLLRDTVRLAGDCGGHLPYPELPGYLFDARGKPTASAQVLESFVALRNRLWGHGAGRTDAVFAEVDRIAREVEQAAAEDRAPRLAADELPNSYASFFRDVARQVQVAHFSGQAVSSVAFLPDGKRLIIGMADGPALVRELVGERRVVHLHGHEGRISAVAASTGGRVATGGVDGTARVWDPDSGVELACLRHPAGQCRHDPSIPYAVSGLAFSPDGRRLVTGSGDRTVRVWDVERGTELACLHGHEDRVWGVAFSPDGRLVASASYDRTVRIWGAGGGGVQLPLRNHQWPIWALAFSDDGRLLATGAEDRTVRLRDAESGTERACLEGHENTVRSLAFSPDGRRLSSGSEDGALGVWSTAEAVAPTWLRGHTGAVLSIAFAPDGGRIASGSWDGTVRLWDVASGREIHCLRGAADRVWAVGFSPDGRQVWADCADGTIRAWDVQTGAPEDPSGVIRKACAAGRWRVAARGLETGIEARAGEAVAWLPLSLGPVLPHPSGRTWAAAAGSHLCLFTLEGEE